MSRGDVAPINTDYIPNYADVQAGIKNQSYNSLDGKPYGVPHGRGPNLLMFRTDAVPKDTNSWAVIWDKSAPYNGQALDLRRLDLHRGRGRLPQGDAAPT